MVPKPTVTEPTSPETKSGGSALNTLSPVIHVAIAPAVAIPIAMIGTLTLLFTS